MTTGRILVAGATGTVGSLVVRELLARGAAVRALVRDPARARVALGPLVDLVVGDLADHASLGRAVAGVDRVFLACGNRPDQAACERALIDAAAAAGAARLVKLSASGSRLRSPVPFWGAHARVEQHLRDRDVSAVVLRPAYLMTNLLAGAASVRDQGCLVAPAGDARVAMIDPGDVAAAAAVTLTEPGHVGRTYTLTGSEALTHTDVAARLSATLGRPIAFVDVPDAAARDTLAASGAPGWFADGLVALYGELRAGAAARPTDDVERLLGRPPRSLDAFLREHAAAFEAGRRAASQGVGVRFRV